MKLITLDARRRVCFGKIGRPEHTRYSVEVKPDGTLILTPVVVVAQSQWSSEGEQ